MTLEPILYSLPSLPGCSSLVSAETNAIQKLISHEFESSLQQYLRGWTRWRFILYLFLLIVVSVSFSEKWCLTLIIPQHTMSNWHPKNTSEVLILNSVQYQHQETISANNRIYSKTNHPHTCWWLFLCYHFF